MTPLPTTRILSVALRTSGPDATRHSILDLGAVWICGGDPAAPEFSGECAAFEGAAFCPRTAELTGFSEARAGDVYLPAEDEVVAQFIRWSGTDRAQAILAGLRPSVCRSFLLAAARRAQAWPKAGELPLIHPRVMDLHSVFLARELSAGRPVPSLGFNRSQVFAGVDLAPSLYSNPAIHSARREAELAKILLWP